MPGALETGVVSAPARSGMMSSVRRNIVEGEPGIFPDPIARFIRWIGRGIRRLFGKR